MTTEDQIRKQLDDLIMAALDVIQNPMRVELDTLRETIDRIKKGEVA